MEFLKSRENDEILKHFESVLSDEQMKAIGMDPERNRPLGEEPTEPAAAHSAAANKKGKKKAVQKEEEVAPQKPSFFEMKQQKELENQQQEPGSGDQAVVVEKESTEKAEAGTGTKQKQQQGASMASPIYSQTAMENFKHLIRKELENDPYMDQMFVKQFGSSLDEMLVQFEEGMRSGKLLSSMTPREIEEAMKKAEEIEKQKLIKRD